MTPLALQPGTQKLLIDFWHQSWPHNSLMLPYGRQKWFSRLLAGSKNIYFNVHEYFTLGFQLYFPFKCVHLIKETDFGPVLLDSMKQKHYRKIQTHPKERSCAQGLFFPIWHVICLPDFNFFASTWEIARWNLPQACALLQPLINLNSHLLLHILPSKRDYALIISSHAFEGCMTKANRVPVKIISKIKIKTSIFSSMLL